MLVCVSPASLLSDRQAMLISISLVLMSFQFVLVSEGKDKDVSNHHHQTPTVLCTFQVILPILNSVSDDILKVILTNQNILKARVRPALGTVWYEVEEGTRGCSLPHFCRGYGRTQ